MSASWGRLQRSSRFNLPAPTHCSLSFHPYIMMGILWTKCRRHTWSHGQGVQPVKVLLQEGRSPRFYSRRAVICNQLMHLFQTNSP